MFFLSLSFEKTSSAKNLPRDFPPQSRERVALRRNDESAITSPWIHLFAIKKEKRKRAHELLIGKIFARIDNKTFALFLSRDIILVNDSTQINTVASQATIHLRTQTQTQTRERRLIRLVPLFRGKHQLYYQLVDHRLIRTCCANYPNTALLSPLISLSLSLSSNFYASIYLGR